MESTFFKKNAAIFKNPLSPLVYTLHKKKIYSNSATSCSAYSLIFSFQTDAQSSQLCFIGRSFQLITPDHFQQKFQQKNIDKGFQNRELGRIVEKQMIVNCSVMFFNTANLSNLKRNIVLKLHLGFVVADFSLLGSALDCFAVSSAHLVSTFREKIQKLPKIFIVVNLNKLECSIDVTVMQKIASRHRNRLFCIHSIVEVFAAENNPVLC
ncbi:hypothetical protein T07_1935 [Trichinella nelsoni]|uniref:Uncharacterized protein n=1 Tax=Trichinella nelsoni TaxID=6336 RepID=A0A0V0SH32_9BILA|nr:hypothetical protein T07_1935 [Trichinella nelsoni]